MDFALFVKVLVRITIERVGGRQMDRAFARRMLARTAREQGWGKDTPLIDAALMRLRTSGYLLSRG